MTNTEHKAILILTSLQSIVDSLDYCIDNKIFHLTMKQNAKDFLNKVLKWLEQFYSKNTGLDVSEVSQQLGSFVEISENSIKIAHQLSLKSEVIQYMYSKDFEALMKKYQIEI